MTNQVPVNGIPFSEVKRWIRLETENEFIIAEN